MKKDVVRCIFVWILMLTLAFSAEAALKEQTKARVPADTVPLRVRMQDFNQNRRMISSAYPVKIHVIGRAVQVQSDHSQILPIYTRSGAFYMVARLNKGVNWINGLPRGHYFINNRPVTVN